MANSIVLSQKYTPLLDEVYAQSVLTGDLEAPEGTVLFDGTNTVKVLKFQLDPLADYSRSSGYTQGDLTQSWESMTLTYDRGREFNLDNMDNEETLDVMAGKVLGEFERTKVAREVDLVRFANMADKTGVSGVGANLTTGAAAIAAISAANSKMDDDEVDTEGRILYITPTLKALIDDLDTTKSRAAMSRFAKIVVVPQSRFYTKITKNSSTKAITADTVNGKAINFMIVEPSAVLGVAKHKSLKIFTPEENQSADGYKFQYRLYHDLFVYDNKVAGIYVHKAA